MPGTNSGNSKCIMIVDDELPILGLFELTLRRPGFTVVTADSAKSALQLLDSCKPDLFIVDMIMPDMDGLELCQQIRSRSDTSTKPILLISARHDPATVDRALAAGADDFMWKLTPQFKLMRTVQMLLEHNAGNGAH
ncbi:MAG TPA: response regulator [Aggregatilineales bacterium]|nr:response regulator [Aggregatilineales bacterium]